MNSGPLVLRLGLRPICLFRGWRSATAGVTRRKPLPCFNYRNSTPSWLLSSQRIERFHTAATASRAACGFGEGVLALRMSVTVQRPWASPRTCQWDADKRLMHKFKASFGLAHCFDRNDHKSVGRFAVSCTSMRATRRQTKFLNPLQIEPAASCPAAFLQIVEEAIVGTDGSPARLSSTANWNTSPEGKFSSK